MIEKGMDRRETLASTAVDSPYGVHLQLQRQFPGEPDQGSKQVELARQLAEAGIRWTRETFNWQWIEQEQGVFSWEQTDHALQILLDHGLEPLTQLMGTAKWASSAPPDVSWQGTARTRYPPFDGLANRGGNAASWRRYLQEVVSRYGFGVGGQGKVRFWEVWNEQDHVFWYGSIADFELLLRVAYQTIKQVDPGATVVLGGVTHLNLGEGSWTDQLLHLMMNERPEHTAWFDVFNYHDYTGRLEDNAETAQALLDKYGLSGKPIWVTEVNMPGTSREAQAEMLPRIYKRLLGAGVERIFWFLGVDVLESGTGGDVGFERLGLFDRTMTPQPAYEAYRIMVASESKPEPGDTVDMPEQRPGYQSHYILFPQGADWSWYEAAKNYLMHYRVTLGQSADDAGVVHGTLGHVITVINPSEALLAYLDRFGATIDPVYAEMPDQLAVTLDRRIATDDRFGNRGRSKHALV